MGIFRKAMGTEIEPELRPLEGCHEGFEGNRTQLTRQLHLCIIDHLPFVTYSLIYKFSESHCLRLRFENQLPLTAMCLMSK